MTGVTSQIPEGCYTRACAPAVAGGQSGCLPDPPHKLQPGGPHPAIAGMRQRSGCSEVLTGEFQQLYQPFLELTPSF